MDEAQGTWEAVDRYLESRLALTDEALSHALAASEAAGLPAISVSPTQGAMLNLLARMVGAPFDLAFIDADKASNDIYLDAALGMSRPGTLIVVDNVVRRGAVADPSADDADVRGVRRALERMAADPRLHATAVQTVGIKGYDGFAMALVGEA